MGAFAGMTGSNQWDPPVKPADDDHMGEGRRLNPSVVKREARTNYMGSGRIRLGRLFDGGREAA